MKQEKQLLSRNLSVFKETKMTNAESLNIKGGARRGNVIIKDVIVILSSIRD